MFRAHLVQLDYLPAYFVGSANLLEESSPSVSVQTALGNARSRPAVTDHLAHLSAEYIDHMTARIGALLAWTITRSPDLLVFPEYSIPAECLPLLRDHSKANDVTIVGGTHRVQFSPSRAKLYQDLGMSLTPDFNGTAICPIFQPNRTPQVITKRMNSADETELQLKETSLLVEFKDFFMGVVICIDALSPGVLSEVFTQAPGALLVCTARTPSLSHFDLPALTASSRESVLLFCNSVLKGGTGVYAHESILRHSTGPHDAFRGVGPSGDELVCEVDIDPTHLYSAQGSVTSAPRLTSPRIFPIIYTDSDNTDQRLSELLADLLEILRTYDNEQAILWLNDFLAVPSSSNLPSIIQHRLQHIRDAFLPLYAGNEAALSDFLTVATLTNAAAPSALFRRRVAASLKIVQTAMSEPADSALDPLMASFKALKTAETFYGPLLTEPLPNAEGAQARSDPIPSPDLAAFQNRGDFLDDLRDAMRSSGPSVMLVSGILGIGKTEAVRTLFAKITTDWTPVWHTIPHGSSVAGMIVSLASSLGIRSDIDSLSNASPKAVASTCRRIAQYFSSTAKVCHIIDDIGELDVRTPAEQALLNAFFNSLTELKPSAAGRIIVVGSRGTVGLRARLPSSAILTIRPMRDQYIARVIEFQLRRTLASTTDEVPEISKSIIELAAGFPLLAKLAADLIHDDMGSSTPTNIRDERIINQVTKDFLDRLRLDIQHRRSLALVSVFRVPVDLANLGLVDNVTLIRDDIGELANLGIIDYDGKIAWIHPIVRKFALDGMAQEEIERLHALASVYYQQRADSTRGSSFPDITANIELMYHVAASGDIAKLSALRVLAKTELVPLGRNLYRRRSYDSSRRLFRFLSELWPNDPVIWTSLGRCCARLNDWNSSRDCFEHAVKVEKGSKAYILRDWGHILIRFAFYDEGLARLQEAEESGLTNDPSTVSAKSFALWKLNRLEDPEGSFAELYRRFPTHSYTLYIYSQYALSKGDALFARALRSEMEALPGFREVSNTDDDFSELYMFDE